MKSSLLLLFLPLVWADSVAQWNTLPANIYADSAHAPFHHGVASGDPQTDAVIIWTRITPDSSEDRIVTWELASDTNFAQLVQSGTITANSTADWTVKIDVQDLSAGNTYYYRFTDELGNRSVIGRTRTAPNGASSELNFAVISCSSAYSGFFNAYRRIGERDDVNLVIHLGDYVYDFVDPNEEVRVPDPYPAQPQNLTEWRQREAYWLLDPDLRFARQQHPFTIMWDNHDLAHNDVTIPTQAFLEWTPTRVLNQQDPLRIYRKLQYGDLAEIYMLDVMMYRDEELIGVDEYSILGTEQYAWLTDELAQSTAKWKILGSQKMFSYWGAEALEGIVPTDGAVFNVATWDGYMLERQRLLDFIDSTDTDNIIFISGDSHVSLAADLTRDPTGSEGEYDPETGEGALGVELLPTSISRGNFDELGLPSFLLELLYPVNYQGNPHHQFVELTKHGYGIWRLEPDSAVAQIWYSDILAASSTETLGMEKVVYDGANHYKRDGQSPPATIPEDKLPEGVHISKPYPNPTQDVLNLDIQVPSYTEIEVHIYEVQLLRKLKLSSSKTNRVDGATTLSWSTSGLKTGLYVIYLKGEGFEAARTFIK
jgi:alkaline phosphatase D